MSKTLLRIVALIVIPCLFEDMLWPVAGGREEHRGKGTLFLSEALASGQVAARFGPGTPATRKECEIIHEASERHATALAGGHRYQAHRILVEEASLEGLVYVEPIMKTLEDALLGSIPLEKFNTEFIQAVSRGLSQLLWDYRDWVWQDDQWQRTIPKHIKRFVKLYADIAKHVTHVLLHHVEQKSFDEQKNLLKQLEEALHEAKDSARQSANQLLITHNKKSHQPAILYPLKELFLMDAVLSENQPAMDGEVVNAYDIDLRQRYRSTHSIEHAA